RRIGSHKLGMLGLKLLEPFHEPVESRIGNFGIVRDVIQVLVAADLLAQRVDLFCGSGLGHGNLDGMLSVGTRGYYTMCVCVGRFGRTMAHEIKDALLIYNPTSGG